MSCRIKESAGPIRQIKIRARINFQNNADLILALHAPCMVCAEADMLLDSMKEDNLYARLRRVIKEPHAAIHRINLSRIPLSLPPHASEPTLYALGLSRYAELFFAVEAEWTACTGDPNEWIPDMHVHHDTHAIDDKERVRALLRLLYMPELLRTKALEADLSFLSDINPVCVEQLSVHTPGSQIRAETRQRVKNSPHLLVAYIWIMYSAVLYGGEKILGLLQANPSFWDLSASEITASRTPPPLSFWNVDDSMIVKERLRATMNNIDYFLTPSEQEDILDESLWVFKQFDQLTSDLDEEAKQVSHKLI